MDSKERLKQILSPIEDHLMRVEDLVMANLETDIPLLTQVGQHILKSGGKRVRPAMLLFAVGMFGPITEQAYLAANLIEYIHTATLLHDDVVDNADLRRSKQSARSIWGNEASVLVGDYLFTVSFKDLSSLGNMALVESLARCTTMMARGEILQLVRVNETATEEEYLEIVEHKTGSLMGSAMEIGGLLAGARPEQARALYSCGNNIGMAFQLIDDALDYQLENNALGKSQGTDLKERKITLPLSHLLEQANGRDRRQLLEILDEDDITDTHVVQVARLMDQYASIEYARKRAEAFVESAKQDLQGQKVNLFSQGIQELADFVVSRDR